MCHQKEDGNIQFGLLRTGLTRAHSCLLRSLGSTQMHQIFIHLEHARCRLSATEMCCELWMTDVKVRFYFTNYSGEPILQIIHSHILKNTDKYSPNSISYFTVTLWKVVSFISQLSYMVRSVIAFHLTSVWLPIGQCS